MKKYKATDKVMLSLEMTVQEARTLRDELYCAMGDLSGPQASDMVWDAEVHMDFDEWADEQDDKAYSAKVLPVLEKVYSALRVSLGLSADIPTLNGPYTTRHCLKITEEHAKKFVKAKLSIANNFYHVESHIDEKRGERMLKGLARTLGVPAVWMKRTPTGPQSYSETLFVRCADDGNGPPVEMMLYTDEAVERIAKRLLWKWENRCMV